MCSATPVDHIAPDQALNNMEVGWGEVTLDEAVSLYYVSVAMFNLYRNKLNLQAMSSDKAM